MVVENQLSASCGRTGQQQQQQHDCSSSSDGRQRPSMKRGISFSNVIDEREIPILPRSKSNDFFYDDEEIATFRHEKFMEDCGLDPNDFE